MATIAEAHEHVNILIVIYSLTPRLQEDYSP